MSNPWPKEISLNPEKTKLSILFEDQTSFELSSEYLRTQSQSAEVKGHGKNQEVLVFGKKNITISEIESIGNYAIKIIFSDGHDTGLYTWGFLHELGINYDTYWHNYLHKLEEAGKDR